MRVSRSLAAGALLVASVAVVAPGDVAAADVNVVSIALGGSHSCAITTGGGVKCWGWNLDGQLGDGTNSDQIAPVDVSALGAGVAAVAAGGEHTCALTAGGAVKCWGFNGHGDLGDGTTSESNVPVDVSGLGSGVAAITAGGDHTCALTTGGAVKCWGDDTFGELGDGATIDELAPADVSGLGSGVVAISAGGGYTCAVTTGGAAKCWGYNASGQLGDGTTTDRHTPVTVSGLGSGIAAIAAGGDHTCAVTTGGALKCWGVNDRGELGDGSTTERLAPVDVSGLGSGVAAVTSGGLHTCALTTAGAAECWGRNNWGQLGDAGGGDAHTPVGVAGLDSGVVAITAGGIHTCALTVDGALRCWGNNFSGQLGIGTASQVATPVEVSGLGSGVATVTAGYHHTCAITTAGALKCWGENSAGQLGEGTTIERDIPVGVSGLGSGVAALTAGYDHTCALITGGAVKCWGDNTYGQLGDGTTTERHTPVDVSGLGSGVAAIAAGVYHTCALTAAGAVKCWGYNADGELGDGTNTERHVPVAVSGLGSSVVAITASNDTCALTAAGAAECWGLGEGLGNGTTDPSNVPVNVTGLSSGVAQISGGGYHTCALTTGGALKCWGDGGSGELGNGTTTAVSSVPVDVSGFGSGAAMVSAGASHTCAVTTGGSLQCWGWNAYGQVGDGTTTNQLSPVGVIGLGAGVAAVTAVGDHSCALTTGGGAECWGNNTSGQLGTGSSGYSTVPIGVVGLGLGGASAADSPSSVSAASKDASASVSWTPPADNGGAPVYGYAVTVTNATGGKPSGVKGTRVRATFIGTTLHFSGLTNGIRYRFDVAPLNRAGIGAATLSSIIQPEPANPTGYWMVGKTGHVYAFGQLANYANANTSAVTHIESTPTGHGYWVVNAAGSVFAFGDAQRLPNADKLLPGELVQSLSSTPTGRGYWLFTNFGRVFNRGDAHFYGDMSHVHLNKPIIASVATPTGHGYYMVGSDGGIFGFGDAHWRGSTANIHLNKPIVGIAPTPDNTGYWLVASDGGVFGFHAPFRGSMGGTRLSRPIVGMVAYGNGYLMVGSDGGVFAFSNKRFAGSLANNPPTAPIVSVATSTR